MPTKNVIIDRPGPDQAEIDKLPDFPKWQAAKPNRAGCIKTVAVAFVVGIAACTYAAIRIGDWLAGANEQSAWLDGYLVAGIKLIIFATIGYIVVQAAAAAAHYAQSTGIVRLHNGFPILQRHMKDSRWFPLTTQVLTREYDNRDIWAAHSTYRSLNTLDISSAPAPAPAVITTTSEGETTMETIITPIQEELWLNWLSRRPHILLAAETGGGKSTTAKAILAHRINTFSKVLLIDPHSSDWFGLAGHGGGENWSEIEDVIAAVGEEYARRLIEREKYLREQRREMPVDAFDPLTVLVDEANNLRRGVSKARWEELTEVLGSGARKVNISVLLLCQSGNVEDLGISGGMRQNFTRICLDFRTITQLLNTDEFDAKRRRAIVAALEGASYPAAANFNGRVELLRREGLPHFAPATTDETVLWEPVRSCVRAPEGGNSATDAQIARTHDNIDLLTDLIARGYTRQKARHAGHKFTDRDWTLARKQYIAEGETI